MVTTCQAVELLVISLNPVQSSLGMFQARSRFDRQESEGGDQAEEAPDHEEPHAAGDCRKCTAQETTAWGSP
jgi:hypothetical protein